jgi:opacity protein-like surface antigen
MIRKFATVSGSRFVAAIFLLTILAGTSALHAQQTPTDPAQAQTAPAPAPAQPAPAQPPAAQTQPEAQSTSQSTSQEASDEEAARKRHIKAHDYKNWVFNVGGGASLTNGTTLKFARGGGGTFDVGAARNLNKYFGFRADFQFDNLPLRSSALQLAQASGATSHVFALMIDPIINIPVTKEWTGYIVFGASYLYRTGKLDSSSAVPGSACNAFYSWWGSCFNGSLPLNKDFLSTHQNEPGANFGAGVSRKIRPNIELYAEFRYLHGKSNSISTDLRPITIGLRW